jgi:hypothetical protein
LKVSMHDAYWYSIFTMIKVPVDTYIYDEKEAHAGPNAQADMHQADVASASGRFLNSDT